MDLFTDRSITIKILSLSALSLLRKDSFFDLETMYSFRISEFENIM